MKKFFFLLIIPLFLSACSLAGNSIPNDPPVEITVPDKVIVPPVEPDVEIPLVPDQAYPLNLDLEIAELFVAKYNTTLDQVEVFINAYDNGGFVRGMVALDGGGPGNEGGFLAVLTDAGWELVWDGNGMWDCDLINSYSFPEEIAPDCYVN